MGREMSAAAIQLDLTRLSEEERAQYDALLDRLDIAFARIVEYLAAKSGCNNAASLSGEARERLLVEASSLTDAFDQVYTDEKDPDDDDDGEPDAPDSDSDWDPDGAADKLAKEPRLSVGSCDAAAEERMNPRENAQRRLSQTRRSIARPLRLDMS
jgi:hypothetical protein